MSLPESKTIAAVATPPGYGGIGVIRLSGAESLALTRRLLTRGEDLSFVPQQAALYHLINPETGLSIDEAVITYFRAPNSFTGEDVVEISCHGSPVVLAEVLRHLTSFGAGLAQPGEFSLRAFLNRRIDLSQAEAIKDLIHAETTAQARIAARQLRGELSGQLAPIKASLVDLIVHFESTVEFVEDDLDPLDLKRFIARLDQAIDAITRLTSSYQVGRLIRAGVRVALVGRPNVGKSSVFNGLLGRDRAIVTPVPGTTRDTLSESFVVEGVPVDLVDTAGIRETTDLVERIGVERTHTAISEADLVMAVVDASAPLTGEEIDLLDRCGAKLYLLNKSDLAPEIPHEMLEELARKGPLLRISALTGQGFDDLKQWIFDQITFGSPTQIEGAIITNVRHYTALEEALTALRQARQDLVSGFTEEVALANLHQALGSLGIITGETLMSDIINQIFSTFCIGK